MSETSFQKIIGPSARETIMKMSEEEVDALHKDFYAILAERTRANLLKQKLSREKLLKTFSGFGYEVNSKSIFWQITHSMKDENDGLCGLEVGTYLHSCHIESTKFIVLFVYDPSNHDFYLVDASEDNIVEIK